MELLAQDLIPEIALGWHREGRGAVLATVIETWGSAPRQVGAQLAVSGAGEMMGSVSGGCVEAAVVAAAGEALAEGKPRILSFGVADEDAFAVGLACGGQIRVLVEPVAEGAVAEDGLSAALLADLVAARAARQAVALVTDLESWARRLVPRGAEFAERFRSDRSGIEGADFVAIHNPPLRMLVVGAVHIAQSLVPMARACGYDVVLIDPREAFASVGRFPGENLSHDWPDEAMAAIGLDARTAVVTLAHDPKLDDPAIRAALGSEAFYLGCLGSTRTHGKRLERLAAAGVAAPDLARIHAPVGLGIGARSPAEIAVAIMAQVTARLRQG